MADIDIGALAIDRASNYTSNDTVIAADNPANASGIINTIKIWAAFDLVNCRVGTFYNTGGSNYKCRDSATIGAVVAGAERTFSGLSIAVEAGDFIGCFYDPPSGAIERDLSGYSGIYWVDGEHIDPGDEATYGYYSGDAISLYGTGTTVVGWTGKISGVTNPAKIMGVPVANIKSVKGVE